MQFAQMLKEEKVKSASVGLGCKMLDTCNVLSLPPEGAKH